MSTGLFDSQKDTDRPSNRLRQSRAGQAQRLPIQVVQKLAGHPDMKTTQQYYLAVRQEDIAAAHRIVRSLFSQNEEN